MTWDATHYLKYGTERTRAAADLAARINLEHPSRIADLGCGPGNSTQVLRSRWPDADIRGIDHSREMIDAATDSFPDQTWIVADAATWTADHPMNLVYSNAALQWLSDHDVLIPHVMANVAAGGALAFQIPSSTFAAVRTHIHEISHNPAWTKRMEIPRSALTMQPPSFYYDVLVDQASTLDIWETEYQHVMESKASIIDWIASTGLRPFLAALDSENERNSFLKELSHRVDESYETRADGRVLFPFRRTFVIAYR